MGNRARVIAGRAARVEVPGKPWEEGPLRLELTAAERRSGFLVGLERAVLRRGAFVLGPLDLALAHGDRVLLSARNGSGKSTIIAALAGTLAPAAGTRRVAPGAVIALLGQEREALAVDERPLAAAVRARTGLAEHEARGALALFGLDADAAGWPGALVVAAHDRRLRDALALEHEVAL